MDGLIQIKYQIGPQISVVSGEDPDRRVRINEEESTE